MNLPTVHVPAWALVALKLALVATGIALDATGHLSPQVTYLLLAALAGLGIRGLAQVLTAPKGPGALDLNALAATLGPALFALLGDGGGPGPAAGAALCPDCPPPPKHGPGPAAGAAASVLGLVLTLGLAFGSSGCANPPNFPPNTPDDLAAAVACLAQQYAEGQRDPSSAALSCGIQEALLAQDLWKAVAGDPSATPAAQRAVREAVRNGLVLTR